jgi:hypothetical protein
MRHLKLTNFFKLQKCNFNKKLSILLPYKDLGLKEADPEIYELIEKEKKRQWIGLELIASENYTSRAVIECLGNMVFIKVLY